MKLQEEKRRWRSSIGSNRRHNDEEKKMYIMYFMDSLAEK